MPAPGRFPISNAVRTAFRAAAAALLLSCGFSSGAGNAVANGDTRTIYLFHNHTKESIAATYLVGGRYDAEVLKQLNWFLRDWRRDEPTTMDPRLFDIVWEVYRTAGSGTNPVVVMSAYRSPETNAMLRRRSRGVARHSQHMQGKAMDTSMPGLSMQDIREIGMKMQRGGVGYYPSAGTPFVHLDVGSVRSWPRMNYDQLVRLFPDGKTVHLPSNGQPLARYEEARAELEAGGAVYLPPSSKSKSFFAFLFGGGEDDEDAAPAPAARGRSRLATAPSRGQTQVAAYAPGETSNVNDDGSRNFFAMDANRSGSQQVARAETNLPRGETYMAPQAAPAAQPAQQAAQPVPQPEKTQVAALDQNAIRLAKPQPVDDDAESALNLATAPMPPRRPDDLPTFAAFAPLPPSRPSEFRSIAYNQPLANAPLRRDAIGEMLSGPARGDAVGSIGAKGSIGTKGSIGLRAATFAPLPPPRQAIAPARLDRSNFGALTAPQPLAKTTTQSVLGSAAIGTRSAARAVRAANGALKPEPHAATSRFSSKPAELPTMAFAPSAPARQRSAQKTSAANSN